MLLLLLCGDKCVTGSARPPVISTLTEKMGCGPASIYLSIASTLLSVIPFLVFLSLSTVASRHESPEVNLSLGKVRGLYQKSFNGKEIRAFLGIPYAQPPTGDLRFKDPVPVASWIETLNATAHPNICKQSNTRDVGSEDCLYLNVYTPEVSEHDSKLDVLFVIHGGGFQDGHGHLHGPEYLLDEKDVVMVTFNYRLGILGFLSLQDDILPGNYGLKDQLLALQWVRNNIDAFGGDPNKITLIGCSAGSASVEFHMLSQKSRGLFQKAVAISGSVLNPWAMSENPKSKAIQIAKSLGCPVSESMEIVECLRKLPAEQVTSQARMFVKFLGFQDMLVTPVVENPSAGAFLDRSPVEIIKSGSAADVPLLITHTDDDAMFVAASIFMNSSALRDLENNWEEYSSLLFYYDVKDELKNEVAQSIRKFYLGDKSISEALPQFIKIFNERYLDVGLEETSKLHAANSKSPVYSYILTHTGGKRLSDAYNHSELYKGGAVHGDDFFYIFHSPDIIPKRTGDPVEEAMSKTMINLLMDFIQQTPVPEWRTVQSSLPGWTYLEIAGPEPSQLTFKTKIDFPSERFWKSLPLEENVQETVSMRTKSEL